MGSKPNSVMSPRIAHAISLVLEMAIGSFLLFAALTKVAVFGRFAGDLAKLLNSPWGGHILGNLLISLELALGAAVILRVAPVFSVSAVRYLAIAFVGYTIFTGLRSGGMPPSCNCLGDFTPKTLAGKLLVDGILLGFASVCCSIYKTLGITDAGGISRAEL